jgi:hypothetical protein
MAHHLTQDEINLRPQSNWYEYTLECGHAVFCRARLRVPKSFNQHFIRCPKAFQHESGKYPTEWLPVVDMVAVTDDDVRNVSDGFAFIVPRRILRTDGTDHNGKPSSSGNPFPYITADSDI